MSEVEPVGAAPVTDLPRLDAATLFRAHAAFVARLLNRAGVAERDLDDLVQEVFVVAHRRGGFVVATAKPTTWLARIALGLAANYRRKRRSAPADPARADELCSPDAADGGRAAARAQEALWAMGDDKRLVFMLYELEGVTGDEIAASLDIPIGTVWSRLSAARRAFVTALQGEVNP